MKPGIQPRTLARARSLIRTELGTSLRDSVVYGLGAGFAILIGGLLIAAA
jgi:hypothetical protein